MSDSDLRIIFREGGFVLVGFILQIGLTFLARTAIARYLSVTNFGTIEFAHSIVMLTSTILLLGLPNGVSRYLPRLEEKESRRGVIVSAFHIVIPVAVLGAIVLSLLSESLAIWLGNPDLAVIIRIFSVSLPFIILFRLCIGVARGVESSRPRVLLKNFLLPISRFGFVALFVIAGASVLEISVAYAFPYVLATIFAFYFVYRETNIFDNSVPTDQMYGSLLKFSLPLVITGTMFSILTKIDTILLGVLLSSTSPVGVYRAVYPLARLLLISMLSFNYIIMPVLSRLDQQNNVGEMQRIYTIVTKWILATTLPVLLVFLTFPRIVISYTFGSKYATGAVALLVLSAGFFVRSVAGPNDSTLQSIGETKTLMIDSVLITILNVILNVVLIPIHGVVGAALATSITFVVFNVVMTYQLNQLVGIQPLSKTMGRIGIIAVCPYLLALLFTDVTSGIYRLALVVTFFTPPYLFLLWTFVVGEDEQALLSEAKDSV